MSVADLKKKIEQNGWSAISVGAFDFAAMKSFDYQLEAHHCHPTRGYTNTFYIWHKGQSKPNQTSGGGSGSGNLVKIDSPIKTWF